MKRTRIRYCRDCEETYEGDQCSCGHTPQSVPTITDMWGRGGITLRHVEENPRHFASKRELTRYCNERGLSSGALL